MFAQESEEEPPQQEQTWSMRRFSQSGSWYSVHTNRFESSEALLDCDFGKNCKLSHDEFEMLLTQPSIPNVLEELGVNQENLLLSAGVIHLENGLSMAEINFPSSWSTSRVCWGKTLLRYSHGDGHYAALYQDKPKKITRCISR